MRRERIAAAAGLCLGFASANSLLPCNHLYRCMARVNLGIYDEDAIEQDSADPYAAIIEKLVAGKSAWIWVHVEQHPPLRTDYLIAKPKAAAPTDHEQNSSEAP